MTQLSLNLSSKPLTHKERVLYELDRARGEWVADLYGKTRCMVHSRIADLRRDGHRIEMRKFGNKDYRYRLIYGQNISG